MTASEFLKLMREKRAVVELDNKLANRSVNEGFSGGEKKRNEIFQMAMLEPKLSILDETDSGSNNLLTSVYLYFSCLRVGKPNFSKSAKACARGAFSTSALCRQIIASH